MVIVMSYIFNRLRKKKFESPSDLDLDSELQRLKLDITDRDATIDTLKLELAQAKEGERSRIRQIEEQRVEDLIFSVSTPVAQLTAQSYLLESGIPVKAMDILVVSKNLITSLQTIGLKINPLPGEIVLFDAAIHEPVQGTVIATDERALVKIGGIGYKDKVIRKAVVTRYQSP